MILIVEGTDGVGKTTFCKWYSALTGATYLHAGPPKNDDPWVEYVEPLEQDHPYVLDRWHFGEIVWPELFGRESIFKDEATWHAVNEVLVSRGARLLLITRDVDHIRMELKKRGESDLQIGASITGQRGLLRAAELFLHPMPISIATSDFIHQLVSAQGERQGMTQCQCERGCVHEASEWPGHLCDQCEAHGCRPKTDGGVSQ